MSKPKKDWTALNIRMSSDIYDTLTQYADDKGQNKTVAVERILKEHLEKEVSSLGGFFFIPTFGLIEKEAH